MKKLVTIQVNNHIAKITLENGNHHNILSPQMTKELTQAFREAEKNTHVQSIILYTHHPHFCAGADLRHMMAMGKTSHAKNLSDAKKLGLLFSTIHHCKKPTICCVQGKTLGGGLGLMCACDIIIASPEASFCFSEVKLGLIPAIITPVILKRIPLATAKYWILTAKTLSADEAKQMHLVDETAENSIQVGLTLANQLQQYSFSALCEVKKWLNAFYKIDKDLTEKSAKKLAKLRSQPETLSRIRYFLE